MVKSFKLEITNFENVAMKHTNHAVETILDHVAEEVLAGKTSGKCYDHNGNSVGTWEFVQ